MAAPASRPGVRPGLAATVLAAAALVVLAALVVAGGLTRLDQYAVDHWMPELEPDGRHAPFVSVDQLYPHLGSPLQTLCAVWTYPASALVSGLVLVACCAVLDRRGRRRAALAWAVAWIVANAVEVLGKSALERPALSIAIAAGRGVLGVFESSFPSGHAMRAVLTAGLVASVWPRVALPAIVWAVGVMPALVVLGAHTPSDVVGGALAGLVAVLAVETWLGANGAAGLAAPRRAGLRSAVAEDP